MFSPRHYNYYESNSTHIAALTSQCNRVTICCLSNTMILMHLHHHNLYQCTRVQRCGTVVLAMVSNVPFASGDYCRQRYLQHIANTLPTATCDSASGTGNKAKCSQILLLCLRPSPTDAGRMCLICRKCHRHH